MKLSPDLIKNYLSRRETDLLDCTKALKEKNFELLLRIGHKLKGNALIYGYPELGELGAQMEESAGNKNSDELSRQIERFKHLLDTIPKSPTS